MKPILVALILLILPSVALSAFEQESMSCGKLPPRPQYNPPDVSTVGCYCGPNLRNIAIPLTKSFRVKAACNLGWSTIDGDKAIDLSNGRVSFERYTEDGNIPPGELLLVGGATLRGTLSFEPVPAGEWWFTPVGNPVATGGPLTATLGTFKLAGEHSQEELHVPLSLRQADCWRADVTLRVIDIWLHIGGTDESGAWPAKYNVLTIAGHRACQ